ncbi:hypothetical protein CMUS01_14453 [Colletotrichum musicola]|uniref:Hsp70-like protein n=1 Tax=Colletotrichum musicola TaxID=2175873 RepID=A0A8H6J498_9PEZI|nr:hypothetical protein CMUS01_14453 [Colletotrichum musicola]
MLEESVEGTIKLIECQISQIDRQNLTAAAIFLSGGFSESPYLRKEIRTLAEEKRCMFYSDGDRWTAVAKGAVLMGLGAGCDVPPAQLQCPFNIGVVVSARFTQFDHEDRQMYQDTLDGNYRARNHIKWVVKQGDLVSPGEGIVERVHVRRKFTQNGNKSGRVIVVLSTGEVHQNHPDNFEVDSIDPYDEEEMHVELRVNQQSEGAKFSAPIYWKLAFESQLSVGFNRPRCGYTIPTPGWRAGAFQEARFQLTCNATVGPRRPTPNTSTTSAAQRTTASSYKMNSWKHVNHYTESNTRWVEMMNLSTPELGVGWIPANVVAIPETLNNSIASRYPPNTTFIENVSEERIGEKPQYQQPRYRMQ